VTAAFDGSRAAAALFERMDPEARSRLDVRESDGIPFLEAKLPGVFRAAFTTRMGGDSGGPYTSFNLDPGSADDPMAVQRNRSLLERILRGETRTDTGAASVDRLPGYRLVSPAQTHGLRVVGAAEYVVGLEDEAGHGRGSASCDGLTIHAELDRGLAPLLLFADCVPVIMVGEVDMAVVHGGWRGMLGGIVQEGARAMTGPPGSAFIGPSVGPCCFSVADEVAQAFARRFGPEVVVGSQESPRVDLWAAANRALAEFGVESNRVVNPRLCTVCNRDLFFSYRADGPVTGRQGCVAWTVAK
jgi:copper oxidase (laccase) domain-containing protein